jgi:hypothetical protein
MKAPTKLNTNQPNGEKDSIVKNCLFIFIFETIIFSH